MTPALEIHTVVSVPFEENTYVDLASVAKPKRW